MRNKTIGIGVLGALLILTLMIGSGSGFLSFAKPSQSKPVNTMVDQRLQPFYHSKVCVSVNGKLIGCHHNIVVNTGLNMIKTSLKDGTVNQLNQLALGDGAAPTATDTALPGIISANGCGIGTIDSSKDNGVGNFSVWKTWTATGTQTINSTGLYKSDGTTFFGGSTFTETTLQANDQITTNYTIWVENS